MMQAHLCGGIFSRSHAPLPSRSSRSHAPRGNTVVGAPRQESPRTHAARGYETKSAAKNPSTREIT